MPARALTRLGASVFLTVLSLVSIILLLPSSKVSIKLQKIALGSTIDNYGDLWGWGSGDATEEGGVRLVVFGDSWVDDTLEDGESGKGRSWAEVLCEVINCTSYLNFAASQPTEAYPSSPPTGAVTSNNIFISSLATSSAPPETLAYDLLPDLSAQIQSFLALPPPNPKPKETIFVVNFGMWDLYHYAGLDPTISQNITDVSLTELFHQLDILYAHYGQSFSSAHVTVQSAERNSTNNTDSSSAPLPFRVIIPKLSDPTLLPGWISQRPVPLAPSSVAEHQKNAVYLTARWNGLLENKIGTWIKDIPKPSETNSSMTEDGGKNNATKEIPEPIAVIEKDVFYFDLSRYLVDIIIEHQLEDEGLSDASGLGTGESPFESVYTPCVREAGDEVEEEGFADLNGQVVCKEPEEYLFWDNWTLGSVAKEAIGKEIGAMVLEGNSVQQMWTDGKIHGA